MDNHKNDADDREQGKYQTQREHKISSNQPSILMVILYEKALWKNNNKESDYNILQHPLRPGSIKKKIILKDTQRR